MIEKSKKIELGFCVFNKNNVGTEPVIGLDSIYRNIQLLLYSFCMIRELYREQFHYLPLQTSN